MALPHYVTGLVWSMVNAAATVLVPFGIFVFFARMAGPQVIGLVALAVACADVLKTLGMQGIYEALLPRDPADVRHHETAMAVLILGGLATGACYLLVLALLASFQTSVAAHLGALAIIGLRIPLDLVTLQPQAALAQQLQYRRLAMRTLVASLIAGALGGAITLIVHPLYGLIAYQVLLSALTLAITAAGTKLLVRPRLHPDCYRQMRAEAWWSTSVRFVAANVANLDQIIIAAVAGSVPLAYFNLGKRIETSFVSVANSFTSVSFQPLFARHDTVPPLQVMRRSLLVLSLVCGAVAACFLVKGRLLVVTLFGQQWLPAATIVQVLAVSGAVKAVGCVPGALLSVTGRNRELFWIAVASALATAAAALLLTPFGVVWCAIGLLVKNVLSVVWLAFGQRDRIPRPLMVYAGACIIPSLLMLLGVAAIAAIPVSSVGPAGLALHGIGLCAGVAVGLGMSGLYATYYLPVDRRTLWMMLRTKLAGVRADQHQA